jgi:hypothetical protein
MNDMTEKPTDDYLRGEFNFYGIPMGESKALVDDDYGFTTVLRVPGGWIVRLHKLRGEEMTSDVVTGIFVPEKEGDEKTPREHGRDNPGLDADRNDR